MSPRGVGRLGAVFFAALAIGARADGRPPILHEYLEPEPGEFLSSDTPSSGEPTDFAPIDTTGGPILPPDPFRSPLPTSVAVRDAESGASSFAPDRDTLRPTEVDYEDPFAPQLKPYKRLYAYDAVREDYSLYVREPGTTRIVVQPSTEEGDERFFGDFSVALRAGVLVRIPTVSADARALRIRTAPAVPIELLRDGADNWFARGPLDQSVRVVLELAAPHEGFVSDYPDIPWRALGPVPPLPRLQRAAVERVARAIGLTRNLSPREALTRMTAYFRSFEPSDRPVPATDDIYLDLALSKRGVCRHRAFAFLVTALHWGIPTRLVHNEAHAWVEVRDDRVWHRIDLGGAAAAIREPHPPSPLGSDDRQSRRNPESVDRSATPSPSSSNARARSDATSSNTRALATLVLEDVDRDLVRGAPARLRGRLSSADGPCASARIDVLLRAALIGERVIGSLSTDERGEFDGSVVLPRDLTVGDYELSVGSPGSARCRPARGD